MAYQYVREPLTQEDADRLSGACETTQDKLCVWPLLDCGLRVSELCSLTPKNILWQQRCMRVKGKGGPLGKKTKARVVPMSPMCVGEIIGGREAVPDQDWAKV